MSVQLRWLSLGLALMAMIGFGTVASSGVFAQDSTPTATATAGTTTDDGTATTDDTDKSTDANDDSAKDGKSHRGGPSNRGGMGPGGDRMPGMAGKHGVDLDALATFLGVSADDITTSLRSGSSLAQIAEANGKTRDELKAFLVQQYEAGLDAVIDASHTKSDAQDGVGGMDDDATPTTDATPAASTGLSA